MGKCVLQSINKPGRLYKKKNLRPILPWMLEKFPSLTQGGKICEL